jgi:hypothetical protein
MSGLKTEVGRHSRAGGNPDCDAGFSPARDLRNSKINASTMQKCSVAVPFAVLLNTDICLNFEHSCLVASSEAIRRADTATDSDYVRPGVPQDLLNDASNRSVNLRPRRVTWQEMPNAWKPGARKARGDIELH